MPDRSHRRHCAASGVRLGALLAAAVLAGPAAVVAQGGDQLAGLSRSFEQLSARAMPTVVQVFTVGYAPLRDESMAGTVGLTERSGSGVLVSASGDILTNAHVIDGARRVEVLLAVPAVPTAPGQSILAPVGKRLTATVVGIDEETDLAVLSIDGADFPFLPLGDSDDLRPGQVVLALGSPLGLRNSVTMGVVSAAARQLEPEGRMVYVQTDAPVNPGNSGGPLVDTQGRVVGINTLIFSRSGGSEGIGFAVPSNIARHVYEEIRRAGRVRRGDIGVFAQTITPLLSEGLRLVNEWGVILADVYPGGPADRAGLRPGDVVVALDGKPIENGRQFDVTIYRKPLGRPVTVDVRRGLERLQVAVSVVERDDAITRLGDLVRGDENHVDRLGIVVVALDRRVAASLPWAREPAGLVVAARLPGRAMGEQVLLPGDILLSLNGEALRAPAGLRAAVGPLLPGQVAVFHVNRRGRLLFVPILLD